MQQTSCWRKFVPLVMQASGLRGARLCGLVQVLPQAGASGLARVVWREWSGASGLARVVWREWCGASGLARVMRHEWVVRGGLKPVGPN
jgi:hypothetical protein